MSRRLILAALLAFGCKKTEGEAATPPPEVKQPLMETGLDPGAGGAPSTLKGLLLALPASKNGCPDDYDYFPNGGMRIFWCHARTVLPFSALAELSGTRVFLSGPHTQNALTLGSKTDFGHYNPAFVRWMIDKALPSATDPSARKELAPIYDRYLRERGRIYLSALAIVKANPERFDEERKSYLEHENPQNRYGEDFAPAPAMEDWPNELPPAVAFWVRRSIDGTAGLFEEGLGKLVDAYDPEAKAEVSRRDWKIAEAAEPDAALPFSGDSLEAKIKNAWVAVASVEPDGACPDQFAYDPGGLRVQYCRAASVLTYRTLQTALDLPIFLKGPHTKTELSLESNDFGRYNPKFVGWLVDNGVPAATDPKLRALTQPSYDSHLQVPARLLLFTRERLLRDAALRDRLKREYAAFLADPESKPQPRYDWESLISSSSYEVQTIGASGLAFWLRRSIDGTDALFDRGLRKVLKTYDAEWLAKMERSKSLSELQTNAGFGEDVPEDELGD